MLDQMIPLKRFINVLNELGVHRYLLFMKKNRIEKKMKCMLLMHVLAETH